MIEISFTNAGNWLTYSSIVQEAAIYYGRSSSEIIWFGNTYFIIYVILSFFGSWTIYRFFKWSLIISTMNGALGCWIRYLAFENYFLAMFGQILNALAQICVLETPIGLIG